MWHRLIKTPLNTANGNPSVGNGLNLVAAAVLVAVLLSASPSLARQPAGGDARIRAVVCASNPTSELCLKNSFKPSN